MDCILNRTWAEVDLDCIANSINEFRRITNNKPFIMTVVKADAYGHGAVVVSRSVLENGADYLAVASLDEAIQLRNSHISAPILILNYTEPLRSNEIVNYDVAQTIIDIDAAKALSIAAAKASKIAKIHIKLDSGMTRVGFNITDTSVDEILEISKLPSICLEGIFTHFASADETDPSYTKMQFESFMSIIDILKKNNLNIPIKHACNSAAAILYPEMHLDMVRIGISLYGLYPSDEVDNSLIDLKPAMTLKSKIIRINEVDAGKSISYGRIFTTSRQSTIATIPVGYADGYTRLLTNKGQVLVNGQRAPIVGKICMDQCMIDITDISGTVSVGTEVVLFGSQIDNMIHIDEVAKTLGTINYEIVCMIAKRVPRVYYRDSSVVDIYNSLVP